MTRRSFGTTAQTVAGDKLQASGTDDDVDAALTAVRDALGRSRTQSLAHDLGR